MENIIEIMKTDGFAVLWVRCTLGGQTKTRPAIAIDAEDGMVQVVLGTSQMWDERKRALEVTSKHEIAELGLLKPTRFEFCCRTVVWASACNIEKVCGKLSKSMEQRLALAYMHAKRERMI